MYGLGCDCRVKLCWLGGKCRRSKDECVWSTFSKRTDCQSEEVSLKFYVNLGHQEGLSILYSSKEPCVVLNPR